ncbi:Ctr copper transporter [Penicillium hispanicum]|uniref:Ctr copper transporter n=1 Tax=Penicillium hispanicum TaxID=1080232 RepID=UPI0025421060|nr:Ctr copper transporter [Penicillium hispanicum]KAJ5573961.1 Ctr copper transporter [Penicillium hispanicum]
MDMSTTASSTMSSNSTSMAFNTDNLSSVLFSTSWMPTSTGGYVGTWFFLFFLAVIWRALVATQAKLDIFWAARNAQYQIFIDGGQKQPRHRDVIQAWRVSVNLPRAAIRMVNQGISYLLMIAVMTMNVGFFFAVLVGYFIGELVFGRVAGSGSS